jgi:hypothetical protein
MADTPTLQAQHRARRIRHRRRAAAALREAVLLSTLAAGQQPIEPAQCERSSP